MYSFLATANKKCKVASLNWGTDRPSIRSPLCRLLTVLMSIHIGYVCLKAHKIFLQMMPVWLVKCHLPNFCIIIKHFYYRAMLRRALYSYCKSSARSSVTLCHCGTRRTTKNKINFQPVIPCIGWQGTGPIDW